MQRNEHDNRPGGSLGSLLLTVGAVLLLIIYAVGALNTGNWLWFSPVQPEYKPSRVLVRVAGQSTEYRPGDAGFDELTAAFDTAFADFSNTDFVPLGLGEDTLREYNETATVVEIYYPQDIRFNLPVRMRNVDQLLIPIEGRHAGNRYVFLGSNGRWLAGALTMSDDMPILDALRALGHLE